MCVSHKNRYIGQSAALRFVPPEDQRRLSKSIPLLLVLGKLPVPGRPTIWITVGQGSTARVLCCAGVPVYLAPWTGCPPGGKPTMVGLPPGGQPVPGYPTPHPGYLHPRGATYPGWFILPPGGEVKPAGLSCPPPMNFEQ